jgi:hypothetical protein
MVRVKGFTSAALWGIGKSNAYKLLHRNIMLDIVHCLGYITTFRKLTLLPSCDCHDTYTYYYYYYYYYYLVTTFEIKPGTF